jgi:hypothetical protein
MFRINIHHSNALAHNALKVRAVGGYRRDGADG